MRPYATKEYAMPGENIPTPSSPERPPLTPYDPPAPAPQAAAWRRALKVVGYTPPARQVRVIKTMVREVAKSR
jgi:hypothetical protein